MIEHREGLTLFLEHPQIPMDNNLAEISHPIWRYRAQALLRVRQPERSTTDSGHVQRARYHGEERTRCAPLAQRVAHRLRREWPLTARGSGRLAAMDDERREKTCLDQAGLSDAVECRYHGRDFTTAEMAVMRELIAGPERLTRTALAKAFCQRIGWYKPDGGLKNMMAAVTMLAMHRDGRITLPPPARKQGRPKPITFGPDTEPPLFPPPTRLDEVRPLQIHTVVRNTRAGKLWNEFRCPISLPRLHPPGRGANAIRHP